MAHAYTTKRGKNKISKLGVRKDHQQNNERQLKPNTVIANLQYDGPKESIFTIGHLSNSRIEEKSAARKAIMDKCSFPGCGKASSSDLLECSSCHLTRYCGRDCQVAHWEEHKPICKEARKVAKLKSVEENQAASTAIGLEAPGSLNRDDFNVTKINDMMIATEESSTIVADELSSAKVEEKMSSLQID